MHFLTGLHKLFDSSKPRVITDNKFFYVPLMLNDVVHAGSRVQTRPFALLSKRDESVKQTGSATSCFRNSLSPKILKSNNVSGGLTSLLCEFCFVFLVLDLTA